MTRARWWTDEGMAACEAHGAVVRAGLMKPEPHEYRRDIPAEIDLRLARVAEHHRAIRRELDAVMELEKMRGNFE